MIKQKVKVDVDAGQIMALVTPLPSGKHSFSLPKGTYKIKLSVKDSWNGPNFSENYLVVKHDSFLSVDDGFYKDPDAGEDAYENKELYKKGCALSTGGDGSFTVLVEVSKTTRIGQDPFKKTLKEAKNFLKTRKSFKNISFSDKDREAFGEKFCSKVYYREVNDLLILEEMKRLKKMIDRWKKVEKDPK